MTSPGIVHTRASHLFEITLDGKTAHLEYREAQGRLTILHTIVPPALGGRGLGGALVDAAVAYASASGLALHSECDFASRHIATRHKGTDGHAGD